ncbi:unnamed protein product [Ectocarpus sp. CCAP 1310/34]|nr:unnamed protein product [Ectocarpus sp. CCAP 1310/34]
MPRSCRTCPRAAPTTDSPTFHPGASSLCFVILLLWVGGACAFSAAAAAGPAGPTTEFFQYTLVESTDQLEQQQQRQPHHHGNEWFEPVPPPHLFRIPAPGGDVCLVVDENKSYYAMRDCFPPFGVPVSQTGVVDSQVDAIGDSLFGTRFNLEDGTVRGPWCPGGGTAGPLLLWLARHRRHRLFTLRIGVARSINHLTHHLFLFSKQRRARGSWATSFRPPSSPNFIEKTTTTTLEVLTVTEQLDGSLTVALPRCSSALAPGGNGNSAANGRPSPMHNASTFAAKCDLEGYDF